MGYTRLVLRNRNRAPNVRAASRQLIVPSRLMFKTSRGDPLEPACTEGSAEQSIKRSKAGRRTKSSALRTSPWTNCTPAWRSLGKFNSLPRRRKLSNAVTAMRGHRSRNRTARFEPTKPAPPVINRLSYFMHKIHDSTPILSQQFLNGGARTNGLRAALIVGQRLFRRHSQAMIDCRHQIDRCDRV